MISTSVMKTIIYAILLSGLVACQEEEVGKLCLEPPCGDIDQNTFNIVLATDRKNVITNVELHVDGDNVPLSFGKDIEAIQLYGCWNHTDLRPTPSSNNTITYSFNQQEKIAQIDGSIFSNVMVIEFRSDSVLNYDYKPCDDTPDF